MNPLSRRPCTPFESLFPCTAPASQAGRWPWRRTRRYNATRGMKKIDILLPLVYGVPLAYHLCSCTFSTWPIRQSRYTRLHTLSVLISFHTSHQVCLYLGSGASAGSPFHHPSSVEMTYALMVSATTGFDLLRNDEPAIIASVLTALSCLPLCALVALVGAPADFHPCWPRAMTESDSASFWISCMVGRGL